MQDVRDKELVMAQMEEAATVARKELVTMLPGLDRDTVRVLAQWWDSHFMGAGHKRLFQILKKEGL